MKLVIEELQLKPPHQRWLLNTIRCSRRVKSTGAGPFDESKNRCARFARFKLCGIPYCVQHAGEMALRHLIKTQ